MTYKKRVLQALVCTLSITLGFSLGIAQEAVKAKYNNPRGLAISWQINVPDPAPAAVIVLQYIPAGTKIVSSSPKYQSHDIQSGTVKWLLPKVVPGTVGMNMTLDKPIRKKGEIHGKIIFQDQSMQSIDSIFISPSSKKTKRAAIEGC